MNTDNQKGKNMIASFNPKSSWRPCQSTGCSCCSYSLDILTEQKKILKEAKENIKVVKAICKYYKIDFSKLVNQ